jgi:hypothetical protein
MAVSTPTNAPRWRRGAKAAACPRERLQGVGHVCHREIPLRHLPYVRINDDSPRQGLLVDGAGGSRRDRRPQALSELGWHTGVAHPCCDVAFIVERHPCGKRPCASEGAFADRLEERVDRVSRDEAGSGLGQPGRLLCVCAAPSPLARRPQRSAGPGARAPRL